MSDCLYVFLDEGGNFDLSGKGSKYFMATALTKKRPFSAYKDLEELRFNLIELGKNIEYFHACEDKQVVRDDVFTLIKDYLDDINLYSVIVDKSEVKHKDKTKLFKDVISRVIEEVFTNEKLDSVERVIVFTDSIPVQKDKKTVEKAIKMKIKGLLPDGVRYSIMHHSSKSNKYLQIVDYCNWAIFRKWEREDLRSYDIIKDVVVREVVGL